MFNKAELLDKFRGKLIVSCQAVDDEPLNDPTAISLMAKACVMGGASALRLSQPEHIRAIRNILPDVPAIGLVKRHYEGSPVYITTTRREIDELIDLDVECIALDATDRPRPGNTTVAGLVAYARARAPRRLLMADCASERDVRRALELGFDLIGTTLRGYTADTKGRSNVEGGYAFVRDCLKIAPGRLVAEGGVNEPHQVKELLSFGCFAVVVGSAITRPLEIVKRFLKALA